MVEDLDFLYPDNLNQKPNKKGGVLEKIKNFLKNNLITKKQFKYSLKLLSKRERHFLAVFFLIIFISLISIPTSFYFKFTEIKPDFGGSFSEGLIGEPRFINPLLLQTDTDRDLTQLIFSGLLKNDGRGNFIPDLAESYQISEDGLRYRFNLRKNVKWHDGYNFSSDDVVFTIKTAQNPEFSSPQRINWQGVEINKIDDYSFEFILKNPYAQFLNNLTLGILPKHLWQEIKPTNFALSELNLKPIGTGPYKFSKLKKDKNGKIVFYELVSNKHYYFNQPYINSIKFKFYSSEEEAIQAFNISEIDSISIISTGNIRDLKFPWKLEIEKLKIPRYFAIFFNQNKSNVLAEKNIRLALAYSVNKDKIIEKINGNGLKVDSPLVNEIFKEFNQSVKKYEYNLDFAKQILRNSGWEDKDGDKILEKEGKKFEIDLVIPSRKELIEIGEILKNDWENIGAKINLIETQISEIHQIYIQPRDYQMLLFGEVLNLDPDPFSFWHSSQKKDPGLNLSLYDNKGADKILEEARGALNKAARINKYNEFQNLVIEDLPAIFLYSPNYLYPKAKKIKGFEEELLALPSERFVNIEKWYIKTERKWK